ncbi:hypothetical protein IJ114_00975 [Candidatus Saccharibacteria bacterium]|nr:hypothetical protein [Candidatus Saccharibacteria bacterium]
MKKVLEKLFGGITLTWPRLVIFAIIMGVYTAFMAMLVPDGNSFHDIAVTPEWWVLPAILVIVNCKKPLEAALKTFVFFLISQPLVYLVQVPFNSMGWSLFGYYPFWFKVTILTFPGAFIGWYIKKDKWYSGLILSVMTAYLAITGIAYISGFGEHFPNHLISVIYCFSAIPVLIFVILKSKKPRLITGIVTAIAAIIYIISILNTNIPYELYNNTIFEENNIEFVGEPIVTYWSGSNKGGAEVIQNEEGYNLKISGSGTSKYLFDIRDDKNEYHFEYYFDKDQNVVVIRRL